MAAIFGEGKIFGKLPRVQCSDTLWVENFAEIALSRTVKEIDLFIYLGFYVAFNTVQVISRRVVGRAEETST